MAVIPGGSARNKNPTNRLTSAEGKKRVRPALQRFWNIFWPYFLLFFSPKPLTLPTLMFCVVLFRSLPTQLIHLSANNSTLSSARRLSLGLQLVVVQLFFGSSTNGDKYSGESVKTETVSFSGFFRGPERTILLTASFYHSSFKCRAKGFSRDKDCFLREFVAGESYCHQVEHLQLLRKNIDVEPSEILLILNHLDFL